MTNTLLWEEDIRSIMEQREAHSSDAEFEMDFGAASSSAVSIGMPSFHFQCF